MRLRRQLLDQLKTHFLNRRGDNHGIQGGMYPDATDSRDLGSTTRRWDSIYAREVIADTFTAGGGIGTTVQSPLTIQGSLPGIILEDTDAGDWDWSVRADADNLEFVEKVNDTTWTERALLLSGGHFEFQQASDIRTTAGDLTLNPFNHVVVRTQNAAANYIDFLDASATKLQGLHIDADSGGNPGYLTYTPEALSEKWRMYVAGSALDDAILEVTTTGAGIFPNGVSPVDHGYTLLVRTSSAYAATADSAGDDFVIENSNAVSAGMSILGEETLPDSIYFGFGADADSHAIIAHGNLHGTYPNEFHLRMNNALRVRFTIGELRFLQATALITSAGDLTLQPADDAVHVLPQVTGATRYLRFVPYATQEFVFHADGATDSYLGFGSDGNITFYHTTHDAAGEKLRVESGEVVVNEGANNVDFRAEGTAEPELFTVDAGLNVVSIGTADSSARFKVIWGQGNIGGARQAMWGRIEVSGLTEAETSQYLGARFQVYSTEANWNIDQILGSESRVSLAALNSGGYGTIWGSRANLDLGGYGHNLDEAVGFYSTVDTGAAAVVNYMAGFESNMIVGAGTTPWLIGFRAGFPFVSSGQATETAGIYVEDQGFNDVDKPTIYGIYLEAQQGHGDAYGIRIGDVSSVGGSAYSLFTAGSNSVVSLGHNLEFRQSSRIDVTGTLTVDGTTGIILDSAVSVPDTGGTVSINRQDFQIFSDNFFATGLLYVDVSEENIGIGVDPDPQFLLDIGGSLRVQGYIVGRHAIQLEGALMIVHFDGPLHLDDYTGFATSHFGHTPELIGSGSMVFAYHGKFGKAYQCIPNNFTNQIINPSFENDLSNWSAAQTGTGATWTQETFPAGHSRYGLGSVKITGTDSGNRAYMYYNLGVTVADGDYVVLSAWSYSTSSNVARIRIHDSTGTAHTIGTAQGAANEWTYHSIYWQNTTGGPLTPRAIIENAGDTTNTVWFDGVFCAVRSDVVLPWYFDGSMPGVGWTGTAHASTSTSSDNRIEYDPNTLNQEVSPEEGTLMAWVKTATPLDTTWGSALSGSNNAIKLSFHTTNNDLIVLECTSVSDEFRVRVAYSNAAQGSATHNLSANEWVHVAVTWSVDAGEVKIYINGTDTTATGLDDFTGFDTSTVQLRVGSLDAAWMVDDLVITDGPLTGDEIRAIYESDAPVFAETSVWAWSTGSQAPFWVDDEGFWGRDKNSNEVIGMSAVDDKSWGGYTLDMGDILIGHHDQAIWWDSDDDLGNDPALYIGGPGVAHMLWSGKDGNIYLNNSTTTWMTFNIVTTPSITVGRESDEHMFIDTGALEIRSGATTYARLDGTSLSLGDTSSYNALLTTTELQFRSSSTVLSELTATSFRIGRNTTNGDAWLEYDTTNGLRSRVRLSGVNSDRFRVYTGGSVHMGDIGSEKMNVFFNNSTGDLEFRQQTTTIFAIKAGSGAGQLEFYPGAGGGSQAGIINWRNDGNTSNIFSIQASDDIAEDAYAQITVRGNNSDFGTRGQLYLSTLTGNPWNTEIVMYADAQTIEFEDAYVSINAGGSAGSTITVQQENVSDVTTRRIILNAGGSGYPEILLQRNPSPPHDLIINNNDINLDTYFRDINGNNMLWLDASEKHLHIYDTPLLGRSFGSFGDDTANSITPARTNGLIIFGNTGGGGGLSLSGIVVYRTGGSPSTLILVQPGSVVEATTGILNGTTGTDGKFTISTHTDGKIYFENRTGSTTGFFFILNGSGVT